MLDFSSTTILVIGDVMLDKYIRGNVQRMNPEAPVPLVDVTNESAAPGGASNVAANIASLGGSAIIIGVIGSDPMGQVLKDELSLRGINNDYLVVQDDLPTIHKVRVYARHQQLVRFDYELKNAISKKTEDLIFGAITDVIDMVDVIIISDYDKGIVTKQIMDFIKDRAYEKDIKIIVDPKPSHKSLYHGVYCITPNKKEAMAMADGTIENIGPQLCAEMESNILITRGEEGISLFTTDHQSVHVPTWAREVYDVTGAGDTVIGVLALCIAAGKSLEEASDIANHAAGIVVGKSGTATLTIKELNHILQK